MTQYTQEELNEFKDIITFKLVRAKEQAAYLKSSMSKSDENSTDDTSWSTKMMEDGAESLTKEELNNLYERQLTLVNEYESALFRINNKTYGICQMSGQMIQKERLKAIPQARTVIVKS